MKPRHGPCPYCGHDHAKHEDRAGIRHRHTLAEGRLHDKRFSQVAAETR
jgi:hypothetical protein